MIMKYIKHVWSEKYIEIVNLLTPPTNETPYYVPLGYFSLTWDSIVLIPWFDPGVSECHPFLLADFEDSR